MENNYYDIGGVSVIDYIEAKLTPSEYIGFLKGNIIKYISRAGYKNSSDEVSDLKKARQYLEWLIQKKESDNDKC